MVPTLPWHLKLASLSWVHSHFYASQFLQLIKILPEKPPWSLVQQKVESLLFLGPKVRWDQVEQLERELCQLLQNAGQLVCPLDQEFPIRLQNKEKAPALLSYLGKSVWNHNTSLAVVGARKMESESKVWMNRELRGALSRSSCCVISGGALGVDQESHRLALRSGCPTVVVLPSGLLNPYPNSIKSLCEVILARGGGILSGFSPFSQVKPHHFYRRNHLLAQLSDCLLLVQAARRSGSHMSALMAMEQGLDVGVVPGHPSQTGFLANLDLIHDGARVVRQSADIQSMIS